MKDDFFYLVLHKHKTDEVYIEKHTESEISKMKFIDASVVGKLYTEKDAEERKKQYVEFRKNLKSE